MMMIIFTVPEENGKKVLTMDEYISREETIKRIKECYCTGCNSYNGVRCRACGTGDAIDMIEDAPAADVAPVVHGRWEYDGPTINTYGMVKCTVCNWWTIDPSVSTVYHYCPNCGAKMDGGDSDEAD